MEHNLEILEDIKGMMNKSSRFVSLSGLSGISAGASALIGAFFARQTILSYYENYQRGVSLPEDLFAKLISIAIVVFLFALSSAMFFTWRKCKKDNIKFGGFASRKLFYNTVLPMVVGGIFILKLIQIDEYDLVAPACLLFYGLALVIGSKYTLGEIKWVGYINIILGLIALWFTHYNLLFWALGFGIAHIVYGVYMWRKYEM